MNRQQDRRRLLRLVAAVPFLSGGVAARADGGADNRLIDRGRPATPGAEPKANGKSCATAGRWATAIPRARRWRVLQAPGSAACTALLESLKNP